MKKVVDMKQHFPFDLLIGDLRDEILEVEGLAHALETVAAASRLICALSNNGKDFQDLDAKHWGEEVLTGLGAIFEVFAQYAFDRKKNLYSLAEDLARSHQEELAMAQSEKAPEETSEAA